MATAVLELLELFKLFIKNKKNIFTTFDSSQNVCEIISAFESGYFHTFTLTFHLILLLNVMLRNVFM